MSDAQKVTCSECKGKAEIATPADDAWEDVGHTRMSTTNPDGSTGVDSIPTQQRVTWLCESCGTTNEITRDYEKGAA